MQGKRKKKDKINDTKEITKVMFVFFLYSGKNAALDTINVQYMMSRMYMKMETKTGTEGRRLGHFKVLKLEFKFPVLELNYGGRSLSRQAPEVKQ